MNVRGMNVAVSKVMFHTSEWLSSHYYDAMRSMETRRTAVVPRVRYVGTSGTTSTTPTYQTNTSTTSTTPTYQYRSDDTTMDSCTATWFKTVGALLIVFGYFIFVACGASLGNGCGGDPAGSGVWAAFLWAFIYGPILVHVSLHPSSIDAAAPFGVGLVACIFFTIHFFIVIVSTAQVGSSVSVSVELANEQS